MDNDIEGKPILDQRKGSFVIMLTFETDFPKNAGECFNDTNYFQILPWFSFNFC